MGFAPREVDRMSFWQFSCAAAGWNKAHGGKAETTYPSDEEFEDAIARLH